MRRMEFPYSISESRAPSTKIGIMGVLLKSGWADSPNEKSIGQFKILANSFFGSYKEKRPLFVASIILKQDDFWNFFNSISSYPSIFDAVSRIRKVNYFK